MAAPGRMSCLLVALLNNGMQGALHLCMSRRFLQQPCDASALARRRSSRSMEAAEGSPMHPAHARGAPAQQDSARQRSSSLEKQASLERQTIASRRSSL